MINSIQKNLKELVCILEEIPEALYTQKSNYLFESTIGQHARHILEIYTTVLSGYEGGEFSFDNRKRNRLLEENVREMIFAINKTISYISKEDKDLICIINDANDQKNYLKTTYFRELLYCFEHGIHHQALIKVALKEFRWHNIPVNFGVAPSTIKFRLSCVQ
ncbi:hypothetical protein D3C71_36630 [compost metagenome]